MAIPPSPILRAAHRWMRHLPSSGRRRSRILFVSHPEFSDITPTQYDSAFEWLCSTGIIDRVADQRDAAREIFETAIITGTPAWLRDADELISSPDELPEDALRAAEALGLDIETAYATASGAWGKVDTAAREHVGSAGELALFELLQQNTTASAVHVAAYSDGYGYDIAVQVSGHEYHLEVKSTARRGRVVVYLSRHEFRTMLRDPFWHLILVTLDQDMQIGRLGEISREWVIAQAPADSSNNGRWESAKFNIPVPAINTGISFIAGHLADHATRKSVELLTNNE